VSSDTGLRSVAESVPLDWAAVGAYLAAHGHSLATDPPPRQFAGGLANLNYLIHLDGKPAVLRRPPMGELPAGAYDMAREFRILSRLPDALPFIARGLFLCDDPSVIGQRFQIIEYRPGLVIREHLPPELAHRPEIGARLSQVMLEIWAVRRDFWRAVCRDGASVAWPRKRMEPTRCITISVHGWSSTSCPTGRRPCCTTILNSTT
jgi:aminoglycoside phosphotransferase (APT) family kinase protein